VNSLARACARVVFGKLLPRRAYPVVRGPLRGARFILGTASGEGGGAAIYFNKTEPEQTSAFMRTLRHGHVLFDIGANVGYYTILGARTVGSRGKVFAFEPAIRNLAYLYQHTVLNKTINVTIISAACSDIVSVSAFSAESDFAIGHLINTVPLVSNARGHLLPVPTVTVDAVVQQLGFFPDVMKIDVEGAEHSVLKGAQTTLRKAKPKIFLSTHSDMLRSTCLEYLKEFGYTWEVLSRDKQNPSEFLAT
jgi:FkbM family methyltransferase